MLDRIPETEVMDDPAEAAARGVQGRAISHLKATGEVEIGGETIRLEDVATPKPGQKVALICLVHGQNEVGTLQPVAAAAAAKIHCLRRAASTRPRPTSKAASSRTLIGDPPHGRSFGCLPPPGRIRRS